MKTVTILSHATQPIGNEPDRIENNHTNRNQERK